MSADWRRKLLRRLKAWAEERFPVPFPVRVYLTPAHRMDNLLGYFMLVGDDEDRGVIRLLDSQDRTGLIDTFVEEWAHARTILLIDTEERDDQYHHPTFWSEYGRIQQAARETLC
jgi:hypothetical protein